MENLIPTKGIFKASSPKGPIIEASLTIPDLDAGGVVTCRRRLFSVILLSCHSSALVMFWLLLLFAVCSLVTRSSWESPSKCISSITNLHQVSLHIPLQVLLISLGFVVSTTIGCGIPFVYRRLDPKTNCIGSSSSPRFESITFIPARPCLVGFNCGSGEIQFINMTSVPSMLSFAVGSGCPSFWLRISETPNGICSYYTVLYLPNGMILLVRSPMLVLFRSPASPEEKLSPSNPLPMDRDVSSDSIPSVCFSSFIALLSCGAASTGPEDAIETTLVIFLDDIWTSTSLYMTIFQPSDFVVKALSTHSSIVSNLLSSSFEDLSYLAYNNVVVYAFCLRGWIFLSFYCNEED